MRRVVTGASWSIVCMWNEVREFRDLSIWVGENFRRSNMSRKQTNHGSKMNFEEKYWRKLEKSNGREAVFRMTDEWSRFSHISIQSNFSLSLSSNSCLPEWVDNDDPCAWCISDRLCSDVFCAACRQSISCNRPTETSSIITSRWLKDLNIFDFAVFRGSTWHTISVRYRSRTGEKLNRRW